MSPLKSMPTSLCAASSKSHIHSHSYAAKCHEQVYSQQELSSKKAYHSPLKQDIKFTTAKPQPSPQVQFSTLNQSAFESRLSWQDLTYTDEPKAFKTRFH